MIAYGTLLEDYNPITERIYTMITEYFDNPLMIKTKDIDKNSMYICKITCFLSTELRYIICFVEKDMSPIGNQVYLSNLKWVSLQTRSMTENYSVKEHSYNPKKEGHCTSQIKRVKMSDEAFTYECSNFPSLIITLIPTKTKKTYNESGTIIAALETYSTILTFI
jgi:hypothetical protein